VNGVSGNGTLRLDLNSSGTGIADPAGNAISGGFTGGDTYTIDQTAPTVVSIAAQDPIQTNSTSLDYTITFSEPVTGVDASDLTSTNTGVSTGTISVTPISSNVYNITINTISGNGTVRLDLNSSGTGIADLAGNAISGGFTGGDTYTVDQTAPTATISAPSVTQTGNSGSGSVTYTVTYADANFNTSNLTGSGITLNTTNTATGTVTVSGSGTSYTVTISGITGLGTIGISVGAGFASDLAGNTDAGAPASATFNVVSSDATLSGLAISQGTLTPIFAPGQMSYTASVSNAVATVTVTPASSDINATIQVNGVTVASGVASDPIALTEGGTTTINTVVTAQDGTIATYSVTVTRAPSGNARLSTIALTPHASLVNTGTVGTTTSYSATVANGVTSVTVTPTAQDPTATIKVNGATVSSGTASGPIALGAEGSTTNITTVVTSQNGAATRTYSIAVTRAPSSDPRLSTIVLSPYAGLVNTGTAGSTTTYTASVSGATTSLTVTPTAIDPNTTIKVNGATVASGSASGSLALGAEGSTTTITIIAKAQDGITTRTYSIAVTRQPSADPRLATIGMSPYSGLTNTGTTGNTTTYTTSVLQSISSVTVTPTAIDPNAVITVNGTTVASGTASGSITLATGQTTITIISTSQDGTATRTYTITITRPSTNNAELSTIALTPASLMVNTGTVGSTTSYTTSVDNATTSVTVTPTTLDPNATIKVGGIAVASGTASGSISLAVGQTTITTVVTARDGTTTRTYSIVVTRASGPLLSLHQPIQQISVTKPTDTVAIENDGIMVHQGVSPNGDGINDFLTIDGINQYPDNQLTIIDRNGSLLYQAKGYDNSSKAFDGHSSINGKLLQSGTYFYSLDYSINGQSKHKTGFILLKY
jgi:gliding motility-associated-like protein